MSSTVYVAAGDVLDPEALPFGGVLVDALDGVWLGPVTVGDRGVECEIVLEDELALRVPGLDFLTLAIGEAGAGTTLSLRFIPDPLFVGLSDVPVVLRVDPAVLRPVKPSSWEVDEGRQLEIVLAHIDVGLGDDGTPTLGGQGGLTVPRCRVGDLPLIISATGVRWCSPADAPPAAAAAPDGFVGLYLKTVTVEIDGIGTAGRPLVMATDFLLGTGGVSGTVNAELSAEWTGSAFDGALVTDLLGFDGALTHIQVKLHQGALTGCEIAGNVRVPYLDRIIGVSLGFDGAGGLTAIASTPTCTFAQGSAAAAATTGPAGYLLNMRTDAFELDVSRVEFTAGAGRPAAVAFCGRAALDVAGLDLPPVGFQGLRIDTTGQVAVDGGWIDVDTARSASLKGFPLQITKIGFGAEPDGRRWVGLNGGIKLADGLPLGASVEGLRVTWDPQTHAVDVRLDGIGIELAVPGAFSFAGTVAFFSTSAASGFRGSVKLKLDTVKLTVDASLMVGRTGEGTTFFYLYLDLELPAGVPLFSTGAAVYGFAGLVATNLRPARSDGEDWYHGYYHRSPVGVTDAAKWTVSPGAFAIGLGATVGSLPDTGFALSAKALLVLVLPGPQLLLQGKANFLTKKPGQKDPASEGTFEALLVLDIPGRLFQANLAAAYRIPGKGKDPTLLDVTGGVETAFSWAPAPPADLWHVYLGEREPAERRIHATLFKLWQGDAWLMANRPGSKAAGLGRDEFVIGGSIGLSRTFDYGVAKAWFDASLLGEASISWDPPQFTGHLAVHGAGGVSAFGMSVVASVDAKMDAKAPNPWYFAVAVEIGLKIDLLLFTWQFHAKLPLEFGDKDHPLPQPITELAVLSADHAKVDEARPLAGATVPPDVRPLITFTHPVADRARFGSPGRYAPDPEDLGLRQVSYQLRHVVLVSSAGAGQRLVGAAGETTVTGTAVTFTGLPAGDGLPDLTGAILTLLGDAGEIGRFPVSSGGGTTATLCPGPGGASPPTGTFSYRLTAPRATAAVTVSAVAEAGGGDAAVTLAGALADPARFRGGELRQAGGDSWLVLDATATTLRVRAAGAAPNAGETTTVLAPLPAELRACWAPFGPAGAAIGSATRLWVWARTPYAFFRHNDVDQVQGLDPFQPGYACGPEATEEPVCVQFADLADGALAGPFTTEGLAGEAVGDVRVAAHRLALGRPAGGGSGTVTFRFEPPLDAVWVTASAREAGRVVARAQGTEIGRRTLTATPASYQFSGGVDELVLTGTLAVVDGLCFVPGWTCVHFDAASFPPAGSGTLSYAGLHLQSTATMSVAAGVLEVATTAPLAVAVPVSLTVLFPPAGHPGPAHAAEQRRRRGPRRRHRGGAGDRGGGHRGRAGRRPVRDRACRLAGPCGGIGRRAGTDQRGLH
ncbi:hypothetical protein [Frankia sp. Cppng1_Ct_nod]|uniref:hypothetical protein n=1 Tax=Frankia sp. Cppng1_Ct_nod TaxID=2897162 RepID=UPI002025A6E6|nr:hypothetical protein [Frankia sp. Cppng1_Ct_nod]